jgi:hypothetical protein
LLPVGQTDILKFSKFEISNPSSLNKMDQSSDSDDDNDKLHGSISLGTEDEDVNNVGKS